MEDFGKKSIVGSHEKAFAIDINIVKKNEDFMIEGWMYIFDYVMLTKMKSSKDCFRKRIVKFYKNYFPEYSYFKQKLGHYEDFKKLPDKKNYLERINTSSRFYRPSYQLKIEYILSDRGYEDDDDFYDIVYQFKKLIKDLLLITYNSFYNESLILKDALILEFCYQQLKYLEMEYFYSRMSFEIKNKNFVMERMVCIIRRFYHFWVELLFETYCWYERKRYHRNDTRSRIHYEEEKFFDSHKGLLERLDKYKNSQSMGKKQLFFDQKHWPREENQKKQSKDNEMYEFSFEEFCQQDDFDDSSLYNMVYDQDRNFKKLQNQRGKHKQLKFDLKADDILSYYPFIFQGHSGLEVKQINSRYSPNKDLDDTSNFLKQIEMLVEININILHAFLFSDYPNWNYYEQQYIMVIQLYSFLKKVLKNKSILISIVETYEYFESTSGCDIEYFDDQISQTERERLTSSSYNKSHSKEDTNIKKAKEISETKELVRRKPWWWRKMGPGVIDEDAFDDGLDFHGDDVDRIFDRESKAIERIINKILKQDHLRLMTLFKKYFRDELDDRDDLDEMYFIFQNDSIIVKKDNKDNTNRDYYEYYLDDALSFDLQILICQQQVSNIKMETRSEAQLSPQSSMKKQDEEIQTMQKQGDKENNDNSFDIEDQYEDREFKSARQFYKSCLDTKHQSKKYIMPLPFQCLTFPDLVNTPVNLTEFKDNSASTDPYFEDILVKPTKMSTQPQSQHKMDDPSLRNRSQAMSQSEQRITFQQKSTNDMIFFSKDDEVRTDIERLRDQGKNIRDVIPFGNFRGREFGITNILDDDPWQMK